MKTPRKIIFAIAAVACLAAAALWVSWERAKPLVSTAPGSLPHIPLIDTFYERQNFFAAQALAAKIKPESGVRAVVVPHHLLASRFVADALARAAGTKYKTVVVVGPNHDNRGPDLVSSVAVAYETPSGLVLPDEEKVAQLRQLFSCRSDATVFLPEHSVGAMVPTIAQDFPDAKIVPVILSSKVGKTESDKLSAWLSRLPASTLVVFSVDFSHYLTADQAAAKDAETAAALASRDVATIGRWGNDHIDSPFTIVTMLKYANKIGAGLEVAAHANANDFLAVKAVSTTSYFEIIISK